MKKINYFKIQEMLDAGYSWEEIRSKGFTDSDRKYYYGWRAAWDMFDKKLSDEHVAEREQNLRLQRKLLSYERSINNEQIRDIALNQSLSAQMLEELRKGGKTYKLGKPKKRTSKENASWVVTTSDAHFNGDEKLFKEVLEETRDRIKAFVEQNAINSIYLVEMGDLIEGAGNLRPSQAQAVRSGMIPQIIKATQMYGEFLKEVSQFVNVKFVVITSSNHTQLRLMGSKQNELVEEDLMLTFASYIKGVFPDLEVIAKKEPELNIHGFNCKFIHGHTIKKNNFENELAKLSNFNNRLIDFMFLGHYHHYREIDISGSVSQNGVPYDKKVFIVPSLDQGQSTFEKDLRVSSVPGIAVFKITNHGATGQKLHIVTEEYCDENDE